MQHNLFEYPVYAACHFVSPVKGHFEECVEICLFTG